MVRVTSAPRGGRTGVSVEIAQGQRQAGTAARPARWRRPGADCAGTGRTGPDWGGLGRTAGADRPGYRTNQTRSRSAVRSILAAGGDSLTGIREIRTRQERAADEQLVSVSRALTSGAGDPPGGMSVNGTGGTDHSTTTVT